MNINLQPHFPPDEFKHGTDYELSVDLLENSVNDVATIPPTYLKYHTSRIMDLIEKLETAIGVKK